MMNSHSQQPIKASVIYFNWCCFDKYNPVDANIIVNLWL